MADRDSEPEHTTEEQKLQKQIESIYLDYQKVVNTETMAPKDANTRKIETNNSDDGIEDDDLEGKNLLDLFSLIFSVCLYTQYTPKSIERYTNKHCLIVVLI